MAYEPKEWACGDVVTADDLNHMEQGIVDASESGGGALIINVTASAAGTFTPEEYTNGDFNFKMLTGSDGDSTFSIALDKTVAEISAAVEAGQPCYLNAPSFDFTLGFVNSSKRILPLSRVYDVEGLECFQFTAFDSRFSAGSYINDHYLFIVSSEFIYIGYQTYTHAFSNI